MGVTANATVVGKHKGPRTYWCASIYSVDASGIEVVKAAPPTGNLYLEALDIITDADAVTITLLDVAAILIGPFEITTAETSGHISLKFIRPLKLTGALNVDQGTGAPITILAQGYSA
ncbi:hypothetical protein LCGC14_2855370 [marine sediment metagenome]|uniref:Uncharacterized protein n=1 Tax=marine sediment metagenome TaxID=412755 RepID=A0A0F8Y7D7_9ZZZZ